MKLLIFGASGSGTTTLAKVLASHISYTHLDADDYYWKKTNPPYQIKIPLDKRNTLLQRDFELHSNVIISGSLVSWGAYWHHAFDLAIFLHLPHKIRIQRLLERETKRYGDLLQTDPKIISIHEAFIEWAKKYDDPNFDGRSITHHNLWIQKLDCSILRIEEDITLNEKLHIVTQKIQQITKD